MTPYRDLIATAAERHGVDQYLIEAMIAVESSHRTDGFRFEPGFWRRYLASNTKYKNEIPRRVSSSYGLLQIMYPVACERGFRGEPERLFVPSVGIHYGVKHLAWLLKWAKRAAPDVSASVHEKAAVAAYNGGKGGNRPPGPYRNQSYLTKVLRAKRRLMTQEGMSHGE